MKNPFKAELTVDSDRLSLSEIETILGLKSAPSGYSIGEPCRYGDERRRTHSSWDFPLPMRPDVHAGVKGLDLAIRELPSWLADRLARCADAGCEVVLNLTQELRDDSSSTGVSLSEGSVAWLARAKALISIDQYVFAASPGDHSKERAKSIALVVGLCHTYQQLLPVLEEHLELHDGGAVPDALLGDIVGWLAEHGDLLEVRRGVWSWLEDAYVAGSKEEQALIATSGVAAIPRPGEPGSEMRGLLGDVLREADRWGPQ